ncbi:hypothetical protein NG42_02930 [Winslowiella iniecta]|uniref:Uncharacterized protein n=1 Tax=Winslowiella iniecta TaxID=1560201 RepID=A0A0L7T058_9GAMM|nr:hypothetical protein NG43_19480 [Winslowiella iniecta]KOC92173.1 hypothetical protein NG42_02930 [Winslowiella iniecta]
MKVKFHEVLHKLTRQKMISKFMAGKIRLFLRLEYTLMGHNVGHKLGHIACFMGLCLWLPAGIILIRD